MQKIIKKQEGITLVALIITIIVMVILAGIIITAAVAEGGIIDRAKISMREKEEAEIDEIVQASIVIKNFASSSTLAYLDLGKTGIAIFENLKANGFDVLERDNAKDENGEYIKDENGEFVPTVPIKGDSLKVNVQGDHVIYEGTVTEKGKIEDKKVTPIGSIPPGPTPPPPSEENDFEITVSQYTNGSPVNSVNLSIKPIIPNSWKPKLTEDEAATLLGKVMLGESSTITTLEELELVIYNMYVTIDETGNPFYGLDSATDFTDLQNKLSSKVANPTKQAIFAYIAGVMGAPYTTVEEMTAEMCEYEATTKKLQIRKNEEEWKDITEEASWSGNDATYKVMLNGTYQIKLELDQKEAIETIEVNKISYFGKYVKYDANQDGSLEDEILYRVLYDEGELGTGRGAQIISNDVLLSDSVILGYNDDTIPEGAVEEDLDGDGDLKLEKAIYSYNYAVQTLNKKCELLPEAQQVEGITVRVRSVGSDPLIEEDIVESIYKTSIPNYGDSTWFDKYDGLVKKGVDSDYDYPQDYIKMNNAFRLAYTPSGKEYWYASRHSRYFAEQNRIEGFMFKGPGIGISDLFAIASDVWDGFEQSRKKGVRPVLILQPGVLENVLGTGTENDPYILQPVN